MAIEYGEEIEAYESGYYLYSLLALAKIADREKDKAASRNYLNQIKQHAKRKHPAHKAARDYMKSRKN
jgi:hypothetical protein